MRRNIAALTLVAAVSGLAPTAPAGAAVCELPCAVAGVVTGSNLMPGDDFTWALSFNGIEHYNGYIYRQPPVSISGSAHQVGSFTGVPHYLISATMTAGYGRHQISIYGELYKTAAGFTGVLLNSNGGTVGVIQSGSLIGAVQAA